jgi:geranylgeranyl diphosphate synthase type I
LKLKEALDTYLPLIEEELRACTALPANTPKAFLGMMHYHLGWTDDRFQPAEQTTGKRLRPLMTLLTCQATGGAPQSALPAAAAVELIHNFSLIHDDIQDRSETRRGRSTVWTLWGEAQAINAGDAMFTLAHMALHRLVEQGLPPAQLVAALWALDETSLFLCQGQHLDLDFESRMDVNADGYINMIRGKTAALLGCAAYLGALVASPKFDLAECYRRMGEELGLAFQIQDDVLGIWGHTDLTGKPVGDDIFRRKKSLPVVFVLCKENDPGAKRLRALYGQRSLSEDDVAEAIAILDSSQAREHAERLAQQCLDAAFAELKLAKPEPEAGEALQELAYFLIKRSH